MEFLHREIGASLALDGVASVNLERRNSMEAAE